MTPEHKTVFAERFQHWFKGNDAAVQAALDLLEIAHLWDDLVDGDKEIQAEHANVTMRKAMLDLPLNPFWSANLRVLQPLLYSCYLQWHTANFFEQEDIHLEKAYMLRASVYQIFAMFALICGGVEWAEEITVEVWQTYGEKVENFQVVQGGKADA